MSSAFLTVYSDLTIPKKKTLNDENQNKCQKSKNSLIDTPIKRKDFGVINDQK